MCNSSKGGNSKELVVFTRGFEGCSVIMTWSEIHPLVNRFNVLKVTAAVHMNVNVLLASDLAMGAAVQRVYRIVTYMESYFCRYPLALLLILSRVFTYR